MNSPSQKWRDLDGLIDLVLDGLHATNDSRRLNEILRTDLEACRHYVAYMKLHGQLTWGDGIKADSKRGIADLEISDPPLVVPSLSPLLSPLSSPFVGGPVFSYMVATLVLCVMILGAWAYKITRDAPIAINAPAPSLIEKDALRSVARITGMKDCQWPADAIVPMVGSYVPLGRKYSLDAGLLEISYESGAMVILAGPCDYTVDSDASGCLQLGKLVARVEKKAASGQWSAASAKPQAAASNPQPLIPDPQPLFSVRAPTAVITDLGTEFGVEVDNNGDIVAHVLEGKVELKVLDVGSGRNQAILLNAGQSARLEKKTEGLAPVVIHSAADAGFFTVRPGHLADAAQEERLKTFRNWREFSEQLRNRDDLAAYYDFQPDEDDRFILRNRASTGAALDGRIMGASWVSGRFPGKYALSFGRYSGGGVRVNIPGTYEKMTVVAWVRLDQLTKLNSLLMSDGWNTPGKVSFLVAPPGTLRAAYCDDWGRGCPVADSSATFNKSALGQWKMAAYVIDRAAAEARFYLDGRSVGVQSLPSAGDTSLTPGSATLGGWQDPEGDDRSLEGRMDEMFIFRTALTDEEVFELYQSENISYKTENPVTSKED